MKMKTSEITKLFSKMFHKTGKFLSVGVDKIPTPTLNDTGTNKEC
jgi:hypothetical protein